MKTAIVFSGQVKRIKDDVESVCKNLIEPYQADVFMSVWSPDNLRLAHYHMPTEDDDSIDNIIRRYNPRLMDVERPYDLPGIPHKLHNYSGGINQGNKPINVWNMYYRLWRGNELRKTYERLHGFTYDRVIRFRFEIGVHQPCPIIEPEPEAIHIPEGQDHCGGICDTMAIGDSESMDRYCSVYPSLAEYASKCMPTHPESVLRKHLELNGISIKRFKLHTTLRGKPWNPAY